MYRLRILFRDRDRDSDILDPADRRLEQDAKNQKGRAVPYRVVYRVIVTVIINGWESHIWRIVGYIDLQRRCGSCIRASSGHVGANLELRGNPDACGDKIKNLKHAS